MIVMKMEDGEIKSFHDFEFVKGNYLALYGETDSYLIESDEIQLKLETGGYYCENKFPILYDTVHGAPTIDMIQKYGVPGLVSCVGIKRDIQVIANIFRYARKRECNVTISYED